MLIFIFKYKQHLQGLGERDRNGAYKLDEEDLGEGAKIFQIMAEMADIERKRRRISAKRIVVRAILDRNNSSSSSSTAVSSISEQAVATFSNQAVALRGSTQNYPDALDFI